MLLKEKRTGTASTNVTEARLSNRFHSKSSLCSLCAVRLPTAQRYRHEPGQTVFNKTEFKTLGSGEMLNQLIQRKEILKGYVHLVSVLSVISNIPKQRERRGRL